MPIKNPVRHIAIVSAAVLIATPVVANFEGRSYIPYQDIGGVWTVCDGITGEDIIHDKKYTDPECDHLLAKHLQIAEQGVERYLEVEVPDETKASFISFAYNVGIEAFRKSTLLKLANFGDIEGACNQLTRWVFVKGKRINGLVSRRVSEKALCLKGINKNPWWGV